MRLSVAVALCLWLFVNLPAGQAAEVSLQSELNRLEALAKSEQASAKDLQLLAEIYFLTSRCDDVVRVVGRVKQASASGELPHAAVLACACGSPCAQGTYSEYSELRRLLREGKPWNDASVQALWKSVREMPEARYLMIKALRSSGSTSLRSVRLDLERSLESLEVN